VTERNYQKLAEITDHLQNAVSRSGLRKTKTKINPLKGCRSLRALVACFG